MGKIYTIDKCAECKHLAVRPAIKLFAYKCKKRGRVLYSSQSIPDWCPLSDAPDEKGEMRKIICKCLICDCKWEYPEGSNVDIIKASCSPCGHQGMFEVKQEPDAPKDGVEGEVVG